MNSLFRFHWSWIMCVCVCGAWLRLMWILILVLLLIIPICFLKSFETIFLSDLVPLNVERRTNIPLFVWRWEKFRKYISKLRSLHSFQSKEKNNEKSATFSTVKLASNSSSHLTKPKKNGKESYFQLISSWTIIILMKINQSHIWSAYHKLLTM